MVSVNRRRTNGFTFLGVLFIVAIGGVGLALVGEVWETASLREKEADLLYVGNQYRRAIERYYASGRQYPRTLQDLLKDPRTPAVQRHLRQLYPDPMTVKGEWVLVKAPDGGIMGVHSSSEEKPLKISNFKLRDREFEGVSKYSDWKFVFAPAAQAKPKPAATSGTPPVPGTASSPAVPPRP